MKKLIFISLIIMISYHYVFADETTIREMKQEIEALESIVNEITSIYLIDAVESEISQRMLVKGLSGPIRSMFVEEATMKNKFGEWVEEKKRPTMGMTFSANKILRERGSYSSDGSLHQIVQYNYSKSKLREKLISVISKGKSFIKEKLVYHYDDSNELKKIDLYQEEDEKLSFLSTIIFNYFKGNKKEIDIYDNNGNLMRNMLLSLNRTGHVDEKFIYDSEGKLVYSHKFEYDKNGNPISINTYNKLGALEPEERYKYQYQNDEFGNVVRIKKYKWVTKFGKSYHEPQNVTYRHISYYRGGMQQEPVFAGRALSQWKEGLSSPIQEVRLSATYVIKKMGSTAVPILLQAMKSEYLDVRTATVSVLGEQQTKSKEVLSALAEGLRDSSTKVRRIALSYIGKLKSYNKSLIVKIIMEKPELYLFYPDIISRLPASIGSESIILLKRVVETNKNKESIIAAIGALGEEGSNAKLALPSIINKINNTDRIVRYFAIKAIINIEPATEASIRAQIEAIRDSDQSVRRIALDNLKKYKLNAKNIIKDQVSRNPNGYIVSENVLRELAKIMGPSIKLPLIEVAKSNKNNDIRLAAIILLGAIGNDTQIEKDALEPIIVDLISDMNSIFPLTESDTIFIKNELLNLNIKQIVGYIDILKYILTLQWDVRFIQGINEMFIIYGIQLSDRFKLSTIILYIALKNEDWRVRRVAAYYLGDIKDKSIRNKSIIKALKKATGDPREDVQWAAKESLRKIMKMLPSQ